MWLLIGEEKWLSKVSFIVGSFHIWCCRSYRCHACDVWILCCTVTCNTKGSVGATVRVDADAVWPWGHEFKSWKQLLVEMLVKLHTVDPMWSGPFPNPDHSESLVYRAALFCSLQYVHLKLWSLSLSKYFFIHIIA